MASTQTVTTIRQYVREYYDLDTEDVGDRLIDRWISEGWNAIVRFRPNWPGFEDVGSIPVTTTTAEYDSPLKDIQSIEGPDRKLILMSSQDAERRFIRGGVQDPPGTPVAYSVWKGRIRFWPAPAAAGTYWVRGYRQPLNPLDNAPDATMDLPHPDASEALLAWVMYRAATREAEFEQAAEYRSTFSETLQEIAKDETDVGAYEPIVLNSQIAPSVGFNPYLPDRLRYADGWEG